MVKKPFSKRVIGVVKGIPKGKTLFYGQVAALAGSPEAARAVGNIMKGNRDKSVPCHRVIKSDGKLGGYNGLLGLSADKAGKKSKLLKKEGVKIN